MNILKIFDAFFDEIEKSHPTNELEENYSHEYDVLWNNLLKHHRSEIEKGIKIDLLRIDAMKNLKKWRDRREENGFSAENNCSVDFFSKFITFTESLQ